MKNRILLGSCSLLVSLFSISAFADPAPISYKPQTMRLLPDKTFIPPGFDDNDNVELIVSGYLPNTCYKAGSTTFQVDEKEKKILIQNVAYNYTGCWCAEVTVPYQHTVNVGVLPTGKYQVLVQDQKDGVHPQGVLNVGVSKSASPDNYLYAPIEDVYLMDSTTERMHASSTSRAVMLRGEFNSDCMHLQEVKVLYRAENIIEVLPIATMDEGQNCHTASIPFQSQVNIQSPWKGRTLIFVRSLNGQAISKVVDL